MVDFAFQHFGHRPVADLHPFADLAVAVDAGAEADIYVVALVAQVKGFLRQVVAGIYRAGVHLGADLGSGAVEETGVGKENAALGGAEGLGELQGHAQFLVHNADEDDAGGQAETGFDGFKQPDLFGYFVGGLELGGDLVDETEAAVGGAGGQLAGAVGAGFAVGSPVMGGGDEGG